MYLALPKISLQGSVYSQRFIFAYILELTRHNREVISMFSTNYSKHSTFLQCYSMVPAGLCQLLLQKTYPNACRQARRTYCGTNINWEWQQHTLFPRHFQKLSLLIKYVHKYSLTPWLPVGSTYISFSTFLKGFLCPCQYFDFSNVSSH